jgi:transcriptional regulator with XRE-family HTH domain
MGVRIHTHIPNGGDEMNRLKKMRTERKMTMMELHELSGISQSTLSMLENGKRRMNKGHAEVLSQIFQCDEAYIMGTDIVKIDMSVSNGIRTTIDMMLMDVLMSDTVKELDEQTKWSFIVCRNILHKKLDVSQLKLIKSMIDSINKNGDDQ